MNRFITVAIVGLGLLMLANSSGASTDPVLGGPVDLRTWASKGKVSVGALTKLGPGPAALTRRFAARGLYIVNFGAQVDGLTAESRVLVRMRCLDKAGRELLVEETDCGTDKPSTKPGVYFKTHAFTRTVVASIEKLDAGPAVSVSGVEIRDEDLGKIAFKPRVDSAQYMLPIWRGRVVHNETVLLMPGVGGRLLFEPKKVLSVRDYGLKKTYVEGKDYRVKGRTLVALTGSAIPVVGPEVFAKGNLEWFELLGKHIVVSYEHAGVWEGPAPTAQGEYLPNTVAKLRLKKPVTIAALGDSITLGAGTSRFSQIPPYMPTWLELASRELERVYGGKVRSYNVGLGGMTSDWGAGNAASSVATLDPDLVLIAFGMNDFWWMPADAFAANVRKMIDAVRARKPSAEFILISPMRFDPAYTNEAQYPERLASYAPALYRLQQVGVQVLDMTSITAALYAAKSAHDFVADPLHPNDFLARWFAQGVVETLALPSVQAVPAKKGIGFYQEMSSSQPVHRLGVGWYYNWVLKANAWAPRKTEFVPMVWSWYGDASGLKSLSGAKALLGFNEPDGKDQANLTVDEALAAWPELEKTGLPLGSPATVHADGDWMQAFLKGARERKLPVDFVTVHWYYLPDPDAFIGYLEKVHRLYGLPIWITEFACVDWDKKPGGTASFTPEDVARFVRAVLPRLDALPWVKRYAWFEGDGPYAESRLFNSDGTLTVVGRAYAGHP